MARSGEVTLFLGIDCASSFFEPNLTANSSKYGKLAQAADVWLTRFRSIRRVHVNTHAHVAKSQSQSQQSEHHLGVRVRGAWQKRACASTDSPAEDPHQHAYVSFLKASSLCA